MKQGHHQTLAMIIAISRGIAYDLRMRRSVLFFVILAAMLMAFGGAVLFDAWLMERPLLFIFYWLACAWLVVLSILMALFDMLLLRRAALEEERRLKAEVFGTEKDGEPRE
ncbi:MAG TPA: hypothetical protein VNQ90_11095 [Chthoniobacteraceae bacterium]|nr:hypothetical protein [Chthoniobacteraceae bacterium]